MEIKKSNSETRGIFTAVENEKRAGEMTYSINEQKNVVIEHTEVNPDYQGQGVGKKLIDEAANFARQNNLKITPECTYARKVMEKSDKYNDVLT
ncbi:MAG TPA: GNAT family N-acetyltransferase [Gillisia sp.]|nr:GNAT family N-acetyltransferase [Gillisia sp.]